jgi:two-component system sensor histidine kinase YesM
MTMLVALIIMLLSLLLIYRQAVVIIERNALQYMEGIVTNTSDELEAMLEDARMITLMTSMNLAVQEASASPLVSASYEWFLQKKVVDNYLANLITNKEHLSQLAVFSMNGTVFQSGGILLLNRQLRDPWMQDALFTVLPTLHYFEAEQRLYYTRTMYADKRPLALVVAELDYSHIANRLSSFSALEKLSVVTYYHDALFFGSSEANTPLSASQESPSLLSRLRRENLELVHPGSTDGIVTIGTIAYRDLIGDALLVRTAVILIILVSIVLILFTSWILSRRLYRNISSLRKTMLEVGTGDLQVRSTVTSTDEIGEMAEVFNTMMDQIESLMDRIRESEQYKRQSEFAVLQSQIHPHFVYNTINSMKYYAHLKGVGEIEVVATAMVELLRAVLGQHDEFITLKEEIHYIEQYLVIQRFKFQQEIEVVWEIDSPLLAKKIPKLLLQPIVENALIHGIAGKRDGTITVKAYQMGDGIHLTVTDNGKGMAQKEVRRVLEQAANTAHHMSGVGISNVFGRIKMIYGDQYGGTISSYRGIGTVVELVLPV